MEPHPNIYVLPAPPLFSSSLSTIFPSFSFFFFFSFFAPRTSAPPHPADELTCAPRQPCSLGLVGTRIRLWHNFSFRLLFSPPRSSVFLCFALLVTRKPVDEIHVIFTVWNFEKLFL